MRLHSLIRTSEDDKTDIVDLQDVMDLSWFDQDELDIPGDQDDMFQKSSFPLKEGIW